MCRPHPEVHKSNHSRTMQSSSLRSVLNYVLHLLLPSVLLPARERLEVILSFGGKRKRNSPVAIGTDIQELSCRGPQQPQLGLENSVVRVPQVGHDGVRIRMWPVCAVSGGSRLRREDFTCDPPWAHLVLFPLPASPTLNSFF